MMKKIIDDVKIEYRKHKIRTSFYFLALTIALLSYFKPTSTISIWRYLGITAIQLAIFSGLIFVVWWFYWRKRR